MVENVQIDPDAVLCVLRTGGFGLLILPSTKSEEKVVGNVQIDPDAVLCLLQAGRFGHLVPLFTAFRFNDGTISS